MKRNYFLICFCLFFYFSKNLHAQDPTWQWAKDVDVRGNTVAIPETEKGMCTDANGNVYVTGEFNATTLTFGSYTLTNKGKSDLFIVKYDPKGNVLWAKNEGSAGLESGLNIRVDNNNNIIVSGYTQNPSITIGGSVILNSSLSCGSTCKSLFIAKYSTSGAVLWAKLQDIGRGTYGDMNVDKDGNVLLTSSYTDSVSFSGTKFYGNDDIFIQKYEAATGNLLWTKRSKSNGSNSYDAISTAIDYDNNGNIYMTGYFDKANISFGTTMLLNTSTLSYKNIFLVKFDVNGNELWAKSYAGNFNDASYSMDVDDSGNTLITGYFTSNAITFGSTTFNNPTNRAQLFLAKINSSGQVTFAKEMGTDQTEVGTQVRTDVAGNIFVLANYNVSFKVDSVTVALKDSIGPTILVKLDPTGKLKWIKNVGSTSKNIYRDDMCIDPNNNIFVTFDFDKSNYFKMDALPKPAGNFVVAKLSELPITITNAFCGGSCDGSATANPNFGTGPYTYAWSNGKTTQTINSLCAGNYTVTVTDANNNITKGIAKIKETNVISISVTASKPEIVNGECSNLTAVITGGKTPYSISWQPGSINTASINVCPTATTTYSCNVTDANGCSKTANVKVSLKAIDASLFSVNPSFCKGKNDVKIKLANTGTDDLSETNINWQIDGVNQTPYIWTGNLKTYDSTLITIGNANLTEGSHTFKAWISTANGNNDLYHSNDTIKSTITVSYSGTYTVGNVSGTSFINLTTAINAIVKNGICGPVIISIKSGTYYGKFDIPQIAGSSPTNTITFQSELLDTTSVNLTFVGATGDSYVFKLNGADYLKFNKLKISLASNAGSTNTLFYITNSSDNIEITNCRLQNRSGNAPGSIYLASTDNQNYLISNNLFTGGAASIFVNGSGTDANKLDIKNNVFASQDQSLVLKSVKNVTIQNNTFNLSGFVPVSSPNKIALNLNACSDSIKILNNLINLYDRCEGIYVKDFAGNSLIANNAITNGDIGADFINSGEIKFYHNTIYSSKNCIRLEGNNTKGPLTIRNNILFNGLIYNLIGLPVFTSDYNSIYPGLQGYGALEGYTYTSFSDWVNEQKKDMHSINYPAQFVSAPTNLHIASNCSENLTLPYFPEVSKDIEGIVRDVTSPYFGAYEFLNDVNTLDVSIKSALPFPLCEGSRPVTIVLKNCSKTPLTSAVIEWKLNNVAQTTYNWTGNLNYYDSVIITLGIYNFLRAAQTPLYVKVSLPNNSTDTYALNDMISSTIYTGMNGAYTIGGSSPDFSQAYLAYSFLEHAGVCGSVIFNYRPGTYSLSTIFTRIKGLSGNNTVTFQSENGVTSSVIQKSPVRFETINNVVIRKMTFEDTTLTTSFITIAQGTNNLEISDCIINGGPKVKEIEGTISYSKSVSNIRILNNAFKYGTFHIYTEALSAATGKFRNIQIKNNTYDQPLSSKYIFGEITLKSFDSLQYLNNMLNSTSPYGPETYFEGDHAQIRNNKFQGGSSPLVISANNSVVANNMIISTGLGYYTVNINHCSGIQFINNSISDRSYGTGVGLLVSQLGGSVSNNRFWNNAFFRVNNGGWFISISSPTDISSFKNNTYYSNIAGGKFGKYWNGEVADLATWQTTFATDTGSFMANPMFTSFTDLHSNSPLLDNAGVSVSMFIKDDFDGQPRSNSTPDIGADEFTAIPTTITDIPNGVDVLVSPNPFSTNTTILFSREIHEGRMQLFDAIGKEVNTTEFTGTRLTMERKTLRPGIYLILLSENSKPVAIKKIVIQ